MADNTLKEFLVGIGYKVDEPSQSKFMKGVDAATEGVAGLADRLKDLADTARDKLTSVGESLSHLGSFAERSLSSPTGVLAFEKALNRLGVSVADTRGAIESLGKFRVTVPGVDKWLEQTFKIKAFGRTTEQILQDLGKRLQDAPYLRGALEGSPYLRGSYQLIDAISRQADKVAELTKEEMKDLASAGIDDTTVKNVRAVHETIESIGDSLDAMMKGGESKLYLAFAEPLKQFQEWLSQHQDDINRDLGVISNAFATVATAWAEDIKGGDWSTKDIDNAATSIANFILEGRDFIRWMKELNEASKKWLAPLNWLVGGRDNRPPDERNRSMGKDAWGADVDPKTGLSANGLPLAGTETPEQLRRAKPGLGALFREWWNRGGGAVPPDTHGDAPDLPAANVDPKSGMWRIPGETSGNVQVNNVPVSTSNPLPVSIARDDTPGGLWSGLMNAVSGAFGAIFGGGGGGGAGAGGGAGGSVLGGGGVRDWWKKNPEFAVQAEAELMKAGLSKEGADALLGTWAQIEAPGGPLSRNPTHWGFAQWDAARGGPATVFMSPMQQVFKAIGELHTTEAKAFEMLKSHDPATVARGVEAFERGGYHVSPKVREQMEQFIREHKPPFKPSPEPAPAPPAAAAPPATPDPRVGPQRMFPPKPLPIASLVDSAAFLAGGADAAGLGDRSLTSHITNNVTIASPDPHTAAAMVGLHLDRTGNQVANVMQGAIQ